MKITVIAVGKLKERYLEDGVAEYAKRLSRYCRLEILQAADEKSPEGAGAVQEERIKEKEGGRILGFLEKIGSGAYVIALAIQGQMPDSVELAQKLERLGVEGVSHVVFIIGGSLGLSKAVLSRADCLMSFSRLTFPHQLMRVILLEQVYRSFRIAANEPYHK